MKKANVNLFDKNKVQVKLLKNKNLRISDGRKHPTRVVNLSKTGITIWTDGKHLKIFRGNLLKEVVGRSVYRADKLDTVEFIGTIDALKRRSVGNTAAGFVGVNNIHEGLIGGTTTNFVGVNNIHEGLIESTTTNFVGVNNIHEGRSVSGTDTAGFVGVNNIHEGRMANNEENIIVIGSKDASEGRTLNETYGVYISLASKFVTVRHGKV